jgi:hypothetical protein
MMDRTAIVDNALEMARIEHLLERLDPTPMWSCEVAGCVHSGDVHADAVLGRAA